MCVVCARVVCVRVCACVCVCMHMHKNQIWPNQLLGCVASLELALQRGDTGQGGGAGRQLLIGQSEITPPL